MPSSSLKRWLTTSLTGHVVLFQFTFALPFLIYGLLSNYAQGSLTVPFVLEMVIGVVALAALSAVGVWFTITLPLLKRPAK